ncbi:MAG: ABC transporter ATP-binding protein [Spirochaetota bacterium]
MNPVLSNIEKLGWPINEIHKALPLLVETVGFTEESDTSKVLAPYDLTYESETITQWLEIAALKMKIEIEAIETKYSLLQTMLENSAPSLVHLKVNGKHFFLLVVQTKKGMLSVLARNNRIAKIRLKDLKNVIQAPLNKDLKLEIQQLFSRINLKPDRRKYTQTSIVEQQLSQKTISGFWLLRTSPGSNFLKQIKKSRIPKYLAGIFASIFIGQAFLILEWYIIGKGSLSDGFRSVELMACALLLFTGIPFYIIGSWYQNLLSLDLGILFRQRLLFGILKLQPDETKSLGAGQYLSMVMESGNLTSLALGLSFTAFLGIFELVTAFWVLSISFHGWFTNFMLLFWIGLACLICWFYYKKSKTWIAKYRIMTNDLVERMIGQRTRLVQEKRETWHIEEDEILDDYFEHSRQLDKFVILQPVIIKGWFIIAFASVASAFIQSPIANVAVIVSLGGILLASQALTRIFGIVWNVIEIFASWEQIKPIFKAASRPEENRNKRTIIPIELENEGKENKTPLLECDHVNFSYLPQNPLAIVDCVVKIYKGDTILLKGSSGGGKSTFAALLSGLRIPSDGKIYLWGMEQAKIGVDEWRRRIASAPQFHENHILTETLAFNLLMGRTWPPEPEDLQEAEIICRELGLGELLEKMPGGLMQMVGEGGWQLSHGEKSRLYLARTLLQKSDLVILDESFASLDPENLRLSLECVLKRAQTLLVIAHP